jgi:hypothetical protein
MSKEYKDSNSNQKNFRYVHVNKCHCINKICHGVECLLRTIFMTCSAVCATGEPVSSEAEISQVEERHTVVYLFLNRKYYTCLKSPMNISKLQSNENLYLVQLKVISIPFVRTMMYTALDVSNQLHSNSIILNPIRSR